MTGQEVVAALPSKVRIGPFDIRIQSYTVHEANGNGAWGSFIGSSQVIKIQDDMPTPEKAVDTFLHECCHAIYWAWTMDDGDKEERIVSTYGTALTALHRDNPWLADWIKSALSP